MRSTPRYPVAVWRLAPLLVVMAACEAGPMAPEPVEAPQPVEPTPAAPAPATALPPFHHGVFLGDAASTPESVGAAIDAHARMVGQRPSLVKTFHRLDGDFAADGWAGRVVREIREAGSTNLIALDLGWGGAPAEGLLARIANGEADGRLRAIAAGLAELREPVLLEPGWEMNGDWSYPWQGAANGANRDAPALYVAAWRHVVDIFREAGAGNVLWVFSPNVGNPVAGQGVGAAHWNWYAHYYPGDAYVDYVGAHGFHAPTLWGGPYTDFTTLFDGPWADRLLSDLSSRFPDKPILIGEFAAEETPGRDKGEWIREAFAALHGHPGVAGAVWFHMDKEADWRVDSSPSALAAYRAAIAHPRASVAFTTPSTRGMLLARF